MTKTGNMKKLLGAASLLGIAAFMTVPANADDNRYRSAGNPQSHWSDNVGEYQRAAAERPVRVWIDFESRVDYSKPGKGHGRGKKAKRSEYREQAFDQMVRVRLERRLPQGVILVNSPRRADLRMTIRERDYDFSQRTINVEHRNKPYKKYAREGRGPCGRLDRALYERVTDQARADFVFGMQIEGRFGYDRRHRIDGREYENIRYGRNLRARTNCGVKPVSTFPNSTVRRYFEKADPMYQRQLRREVRFEVADRVAREATREIYQFAPVFRARLAERMERRYGYEDRRDDDYRYGDRRNPDYRDRG